MGTTAENINAKIFEEMKHALYNSGDIYGGKIDYKIAAVICQVTASKNYDALKEENERLKQALNTILNLGRPNGDYAAAFSKTKTIANNALNTLTVKEDGNNEAKAL